MKYIIKIINHKYFRFCFILFFSFYSLFILAKDIPQKQNKLVYDEAGILGRDANNLEEKLRAFNDSTSTQIVIVTIISLEGDDIFDYSQRLAEGWGIGQKEKNNGLLILVSLQDHKMRIHPGRGLEPYITDARSRQIIEQILKPAFRENQYAQGLNEALDRIFSLLAGDFSSDEKGGKKNIKDSSWIGFFILIIIFIIIAIFRRRNGGPGRMGMGGFTYWGGGGFGGFGSGGSSAGGGSSFGGFGGGSFGGGGASGGW